MRITREELTTNGIIRLLYGINHQAINDLEKGTRKQKKDAMKYITSDWCKFINSIIINNNQ